MTLFDLKAGEKARIKSINMCFKKLNPIKRHLLALGILPNTQVEVIRRSPMNAKIEVFIRGGFLCISKETALLIKVAHEW